MNTENPATTSQQVTKAGTQATKGVVGSELAKKVQLFVSSPKFQEMNKKAHEIYQKSREQSGGFAVTDESRS